MTQGAEGGSARTATLQTATFVLFFTGLAGLAGVGGKAQSDSPSDPPRWATFGFLLFAAIYLYLILFVIPHTPIYRDGDGDLYLASARRLFDGEVMYKDFSQFTFPGTEVLYVSFFKLFGPVAWIGNCVLAGVGLGIVWLTLVISQKLIRGWASFVPGLVFLTVLFPSMLDGTHHWYSVLGAIAAITVVIEDRSPRRLAIAGMLCGFSTWFTHMRGFMAVLGIAIFVAWEWQQAGPKGAVPWKRWAWLWGAYLATVATLNAYFIGRAGLHHFLDSTIVFGIKYYQCEHDNSWGIYLEEFPRFSNWHNLPSLLASVFVHLLLPFGYLAFQVCYRRSLKSAPPFRWSGLMLLQAVGLCLFLGVAPAAEQQRMATAALPATILLVWMLNEWGRVGHIGLMMLAVGTLAYAIALPARMQTRAWMYLDVPAGRVAFADTSHLELFRWVFNHTRPGEYFFDNAGIQSFAFLGGLRSPGPTLFVTTSDYTRPETIKRLVEGLELHRVQFILWEAGFDVPSDSGTPGDHQGPLRRYLHAHYHVIKTFPGLIQIWQRDGIAGKYIANLRDLDGRRCGSTSEVIPTAPREFVSEFERPGPPL